MKYIILFVCFLMLLSCGKESVQKQHEITRKIELKLNETIQKCKIENHAFVLTLFQRDTALIQVVHRSYIQATKKEDNSFGLALNLSFDSRFPDEIKKLDKFKNSKTSNSFTTYNRDGIPNYVLDLESNSKLGAKIIATIVEDVYAVSDTKNITIELVDQGVLK